MVVQKIITVRELKAGEMMIQEGEMSDSLFVVVDGAHTTRLNGQTIGTPIMIAMNTMMVRGKPTLV